MARLGTFGEDMTPLGWYGVDETALGWFDEDLIPAVGAAVSPRKPNIQRTLQAVKRGSTY